MDASSPLAHSNDKELLWTNVALAFSFVALDVGLSAFLGLGLEKSLLISATRCFVQLAIAAKVLETIFAARNPWLVAGLVCMLNVLGAFETVGLMTSSIPIAMLGAKFAISVDPFWEPMQFIPIVGMLCGSTISGVVVCSSSLLRDLVENRDRVEMYLAFGATRMEACKSVAVESLRLALMPTINSMSVLGIISIPGMMTGAILGGASVERAAKLQMIIMFMIAASNALACIITTIATLMVVVDAEHRVRQKVRSSGRVARGLGTRSCGKLMSYSSLGDASH
ncbi:hypothetical protein ONZ45_g4613 [Pleurotus djamor]|nr:hypothetical protein ONZ45_g4613 [Pleurotus djamor]